MERPPAARARPCERRVRVAEDDGCVRPLPREGGEDARQHRVDVARVSLQPVGGLRQRELLEEDFRQLAIVVLARVEDDLLDAGLA